MVVEVQARSAVICGNKDVYVHAYAYVHVDERLNSVRSGARLHLLKWTNGSALYVHVNVHVRVHVHVFIC
jgi:hypothetical protein